MQWVRSARIWLELKLQRELGCAGHVVSRQACDGSKCARSKLCTNGTGSEARGIGQVEELGTKFKLSSFKEWKCLKQREIQMARVGAVDLISSLGPKRP